VGYKVIEACLTFSVLTNRTYLNPRLGILVRRFGSHHLLNLGQEAQTLYPEPGQMGTNELYSALEPACEQFSARELLVQCAKCPTTRLRVAADMSSWVVVVDKRR
jgi:hypothetical protein